MTFRYTHWSSLKDNIGRLVDAPDFDAFTRSLTDEPVVTADRESLPGWSAAVFNGTRGKEHVRAVTALGLDSDKGATLEQLAGMYTGISAFIHTTHSHTPGTPRYRLVVEISREMTTAEHAVVWAQEFARAARAGITLDKSTKDPSRLWFVPGHAPGAEDSYRVVALDGAPLDVDALLAQAAQEHTEAPRRPTYQPPARSAGRYTSAALAKACEAVHSAPDGTRNATLNREAYSIAGLVGAGEIDHDTAWDALFGAALSAGLSETETRKTLGSAFPKGAAKPRAIPDRPAPERAVPVDTPSADEAQPAPPALEAPAYTDIDNAERFAREHADALIYCDKRGWFGWVGTHWAADDLHATRLAMGTAKALARDAMDDPALKGKAAVDLAAKVCTKGSTGAMVFLARALMAERLEAFDMNGWVLNCANGTLDLRTGTLTAHNPADRITHVMSVDYDPSAECPRFGAFLERIQPDPAMRSFLQRLAGYALTGVVTEHVLPVFYGSGANGKSVFVAVLQAVLGARLSRTIPAEVIMERTQEQHETERAQLCGLRLAVANEGKNGARLNEGLVKQLTGGDKITARFMRQDHFEFTPTHKLVLVTNHKPVIKGTDDGVWRRVLLVPFTVTIPESERDAKLATTLVAQEAPGILRWMVDGCTAWQRDGVAPPEAVRVATETFRGESDLVGRFLADRCTVNVQLKAKASALYQAFEAWVKANGERSMSQTAFGEEMTRRGFERRKSDGTKVYSGVGLDSRGADDDRDGRDPRDHFPGSPAIRRDGVADNGPYRPCDAYARPDTPADAHAHRVNGSGSPYRPSVPDDSLTETVESESATGTEPHPWIDDLGGEWR